MSAAGFHLAVRLGHFFNKLRLQGFRQLSEQCAGQILQLLPVLHLQDRSS